MGIREAVRMESRSVGVGMTDTLWFWAAEGVTVRGFSGGKDGGGCSKGESTVSLVVEGVVGVLLILE